MLAFVYGVINLNKGAANKRPMVGFIMLNTYQIRMAKGNANSAINLVIHESLHLMGVNFRSFTFFPYYNGNPIYTQDSEGVWHLASPTLVEVARNHFGCPTLNSSNYLINDY